MSESNLYQQRDIINLDSSGGYYCRHVEGMTAERLHEKSDIAAELGYRDYRIDELQAAMQEFVDRVDAGEVYSKYTYKKFKELLG